VIHVAGNVYALGRGEYGRLGLSEEVTQADEPTVVQSLSDIVSIAASDSISFAVDKNGKLLQCIFLTLKYPVSCGLLQISRDPAVFKVLFDYMLRGRKRLFSGQCV